jgi:hypothetical protein
MAAWRFRAMSPRKCICTPSSMKYPHIACLAGLLSLRLGGSVLGQLDPGERFDPASVVLQLSSIQAALAAQPSVAVYQEEFNQIEPGQLTHLPFTEFTATYKILYKGERFRYDSETNDKNGTLSHQLENFDGSSYQLNKGGYFTTSTKPFLRDIVLCEGHYLFLPFLFLQSGYNATAFPQLSYAQLTASKDWEAAVADLRREGGLQEVTIGNDAYLKATHVGACVEKITKETCSFDVYFSKKFGGYPMRWERKSKTGEIISTYEVESLAFTKPTTGNAIPYPKTAVLKHFSNQKLTYTTRCQIKDISLREISDDDITLDPIGADTIRDIDNNVFIAVPK